MSVTTDQTTTMTATSGDSLQWTDDRVGRVRPRLRHDVVFADTGEGGVFLRHTDGGFVLKGRTAYRWAAAIIPHVDGTRTVEELFGALGDDRRAVVYGMIRALLDRGFVRDVAPGQSVELPGPVRERFHRQIGYIEHYGDDAYRRFADFRATAVLVAGAGPVATAAASGLLANGIAAVSLLVPPGAAADPPAELAAQVRELVAEGTPAAVSAVAGTAEDLTGEQLAGFDVVLALGDSLGPAGVRRLAGLAAAAGAVVLPVNVVSDTVVLGPASRPDRAGCWLCAAQRLGTNAAPEVAADLWRRIGRGGGAPITDQLPQPVAAMVGNALAFDVFRLRAGCGTAETDGAVVVQSLATLESIRERLLPHPTCPDCSARRVDVGPGFSVTQRPEGPTQDPVLVRQHALVGRNAGMFREFTDSALTQSPIKVGRVHLGPPDGLARGGREILAFDLNSLGGARWRALAAATLAYVEQVGPGWRTGQPDPGVRLDVADLVTGSGLPADTAGPLLPARSLVDGAVRGVPVAAVHPFGPANQALAVERSAAGTGAGADADEAIAAGLLSALAYQGLRAALSGQTRAGRLDLAGAAASDQVTFLRRTLDNLGAAVSLYALPGAAPAYAVLAVEQVGPDETPLWAVGAGMSRHDALCDALRDLVGVLQLRREGEDGPADLGDPLIEQFDPTVVTAAADGPSAAGAAVADADRVDVDSIVGWLREHGRDAYVVDTTTPDLRAAESFITVRVLLSRS